MSFLKRSWENLTLGSKMGSLMSLLVMMTVLALTFLSIQRERENFHAELEDRAEMLLGITALNIRDQLYRLEIDELIEIATVMNASEDVSMFIVFDRQGKILVNSLTPGFSFSQSVDPLGQQLIDLDPDSILTKRETHQLIAGKAVLLGNQTIGAVAIALSTERLDRKVAELTQQGLGLAVFILAAGATLTFGLARQITNPLSKLTKMAAEMANGNLSIRAGQNAKDEIGRLGEVFDKMAGTIQQRENDLRELAAGLEKTVVERTVELRRQNEILEQMAITDPLTKAYDRRHFFKLAEKELERAQRYRRPLAVAIIDADHFKQINDTYGHQAGDQTLIRLVQICQENIRGNDVFARYGGEEFVLMMPETSEEAARNMIERLRQIVEETPSTIDDKTIRVTISAGVACADASAPFSFAILVDQADQALYQSKQNGRNRVTSWQEMKTE